MSNRHLETCNKLVRLVEEMEAQLEHEPVILDTEELLFQELKKTSQAIEELSEKSKQEDDFTQLIVSKDVAILREKIKSLYGRVHDLAVDGEFHLLKVEALLLGRALMKGNQENVNGEIGELKSHLKILKYNFRSSMRNQLVQDTAERFLASVPSLTLSKQKCSLAVRELEGKLLALTKQNLFDPSELGLIAEILEEADQRSPAMRSSFIQSEVFSIFGERPDISDALIAMTPHTQDIL